MKDKEVRPDDSSDLEGAQPAEHPTEIDDGSFYDEHDQDPNLND